jgi:hypothetical protein
MNADLKRRLAALETPAADGRVIVVEHKPDETHAEALARARARHGERARLTLPPNVGDDFAANVDDFV